MEFVEYDAVLDTL